MIGPERTPMALIPSIDPISSIKHSHISMWAGKWEGKIILGRLSKGAAAAMIVNAPLRTPAPPHPAIALPIINIGDEIDTAHMRDPNSKSTTAPINTNCIPVRFLCEFRLVNYNMDPYL